MLWRNNRLGQQCRFTAARFSRLVLCEALLPKFANEGEEAHWWASEEGRQFLKAESARQREKAPGSKLVTKVAKANSVQIALRLPSPDLARAREIAERRGIGYQTLLKMIVHEGLERAARQGN